VFCPRACGCHRGDQDCPTTCPERHASTPLCPGSVRAGRGSPAAAFWRRLAADDAAQAREAVASSLTGSISAVDAALAAVELQNNEADQLRRTASCTHLPATEPQVRGLKRSVSWSELDTSLNGRGSYVTSPSSYVRVRDDGCRVPAVVTSPTVLRSIEVDKWSPRCLGSPLLPPRDHLELWLDRRGLGVHSKALKKRGATRVSDLALLSDEELDDMGFMLDQRTEIRVRLTTPVIKSYA